MRSIRRVLTWIGIAICAGAIFGAVSYRRDTEDYSYILFSVAMVVAIAIVAPRKFSSWRSFWGDPSDEPGYWSGTEPEEHSPDSKPPSKKEDNAA
jgi:hypothetical protein